MILLASVAVKSARTTVKRARTVSSHPESIGSSWQCGATDCNRQQSRFLSPCSKNLFLRFPQYWSLITITFVIALAQCWFGGFAAIDLAPIADLHQTHLRLFKVAGSEDIVIACR